MRRAGVRMRAAALLPLAAYAVHQGRYLLVPGTEDAHAHGYLTAAPVVLALLGALLLGRVLERGARGGRGPAGGPRATAAWSGAALLAIYVVQELAEALATPGAPLPFSHGGWVAIPLSAVTGALLALVLRAQDEGAEAVAAAVAVTIAPRPAPPAPRLRVPAVVTRPVCAPLAGLGAQRAPPARV